MPDVRRVCSGCNKFAYGTQLCLSCRVERDRARQKVRALVRRGILIVPDGCEECDGKSKLQGHHFAGYDEEHAADVIWLCQFCHTLAHGKQNRALQPLP